MQERTPLWLLMIAVLAALAIWINFDFFVPGYEHPQRVRDLLTWHGDEPDQRNLTLRQGLDLQGGLQVLLEAEGTDITPEKLNEAALIIQNRVDALGVTEPLVQTQGENKIVVELPGIDDPDLAVKTIGQTAQLEFVYAGTNQLAQDSEILTTYPALYSEMPEIRQRPFLAAANSTADDFREGGEADEDEGDSDDAAEGDAEADAAVDEPTATSGEEGEDAAEDDATDSEDEAATDSDDEAATDASEEDDEAVEEEDPERLETFYPTVIDGARVQNASVGISTINAEIVVNFQLDRDGGTAMRTFSRDHVG